MKTIRPRSTRLTLFAALFLCATVSVSAATTFVAHPSVVQAGVSADEIESILTGKLTKWRDGSNITVVLLGDGATHDEVCRNFARRSADQLEKHWKKLVFTGKGRAPAAAKTEAEMLDLVAKTPGAFGYVAGDAGAAKALKLE